MGFLTWHIRVLAVLSISAGVAVVLGAADYNSYCSNYSVSCSSQLFYLNASDSACSVVAYSPSDCANWIFTADGFSTELGSVALETYPYEENGWVFAVFNVTFTDIKWTSLRFRFRQHGYDNKQFCREFRVSSEYYIPKLFYDCRWTRSNYEGTPFTFEYEAESVHRTEARRYVTLLPFYKDIEPSTTLQNWTSFLYIDTSESPFLTARWQQVPLRFGVQNYSLKMFRKLEGSEMNLQASAVVRGTDDNRELSYKFDDVLASGVYHFEVRVLNNTCTNGLCQVSRSPDVHVRDFGSKTLIFVIFGCIIFLFVCLCILWMWKKKCQPVNENAKLPVVLIMYTPSRAAHVKCMVTLTEYLRNCCFVEALLDQLDISDSETKDPFTWCNEAFSRADFVMVVSSPPKCCNQEGIFRNVDVLALRFLKEKFSKPSSRPQFFSVLMPYCTEHNIPNEAKNLRMFSLMKDFDKMLWYIHNGGRLPTVVDYARSLLAPQPGGGKSYLNERGNALWAAVEEVELELREVCNCKKLDVKRCDDYDVENTRYVAKLMTSCQEGNECDRNIHKSVSTDHLLVIPEPLDMEFPFLLDDLDLTGAGEIDMKPKNNSEDLHLGLDLSTLEL